MKQPLLTLAALVMTLSLFACAKGEEASTDVSFSSSAAPVAAPATSPAVTGTPATAQGAALIARSSAGGEVVSISLPAGARVEIVSSGMTTTLTGESKDSGKRKYYDASGTQVAEVKSSDTGFKVRTPAGALLWKVRISDDKIKVSDNEENLRAWALKTGYPDKAKILDPSEAEIGEVRFAIEPSPARVRTASGSDAWTLEGGSGSGAWGVLMMESVPATHRAIIITELLARGR